MESDAELSGNSENRATEPDEARSASDAVRATTDHIETEPPPIEEEEAIEPTEAALVAQALGSAGIDAKVRLLVKLALENLD
jgi:hypothetical protein